MAKEVKIVNDSMTCSCQWGDQRGVKECWFIKKSESLKNLKLSLKNPKMS